MTTTSRAPQTARALPACAAHGAAFLDRAAALTAAQLCARCPLAGPCLEQAMTYDLEHKLGRDPHGITGVCAGIWFEPGHAPRRIVDERSQAERTAAATETAA